MTTNVRLVANSQFSALSDAAVDGIITIDAQGIITSFNRSAERLFRYRRAEVIGRNVSVLMPPEHAQNHDHYLQRHLRTGKARVIGTGREVEGRRKDGTRFPLYLSVGEFFIDGAVGFVGICHDLTLYHNAIRELVASEERYQDIVDSQDQFICRINRKRRLSFVNRAFATLLGKPQEDILGRTLQGAGLELADDQARALRALFANPSDRSELTLVTRVPGERETRFVQWRFYKLKTTRHEVQGFGIDVSDRERALLEASYLESHDQLTGTLNTRAFQRAMRRQVNRQKHYAVMAFDFEGFTLVNQKYGHETGDAVLILAAQRLKTAILRPNLTSRFGADEFFVALSVLGSEDALNVARTVRDTLAQPYEVYDQVLHLSVSGGIALFPNDSDDIARLPDLAESALRDAKRQKRSLVVFDSEFHQELQRRLDIEQKLKAALHEGLLSLYLQPKYHLPDGQLSGFEVLLRWHDDQLGWISPGEFIPIAESSALGESLDRYVLSRALDYLATGPWPDIPELYVAVNITAEHFAQPQFADFIDAELAKRDLPGQRLHLEITEGVVMKRVPGVADNLKRLRERGLQVAIDDFGSGYSSLSYLKNLMVDELKIDKQFVDAIHTAQGITVMDSIIRIGRAFGLRITAEGIETPEQWHQLRMLECDVGQGFLMQRPVPIDQAATVPSPFQPPYS